MNAQPEKPEMNVLLEPGWESGSLVDDVRRGLTRHPRTLPPRWLYDDRGSDLFDQITRLPEYYQTRTERAILEDWMPELVARLGTRALVELGAGSAEKRAS